MNSEKKAGNGNGAGDSTGAALVPYAVRMVFMHVGAHFDEFVARFILMKEGETQFPGIENAPVRYVEYVAKMPSEAIERCKWLYLGLGDGVSRWSINEHRSGVSGSDRLPDECTATLAAKRIGNVSEPAQKILAETLRCDNRSGVRYSQLPELVKLLHRTLKDKPEEVARWTEQALEAVYQCEMFGFGPVSGERTLGDLFNSYMVSTKLTEQKTIAAIDAKIVTSEKYMDVSVVELAHVIRCMYRTGAFTPETIEKFCSTVFTAWVDDQLEFEAALATVRSSLTKKIMVKNGGKEFVLRAVVVRGDSLHLLRAANYCGFNFVVLQNSKKQVQVFVNTTRTPDFITLDTFVAMLRLLETPNEQRGALKWSELQTTGGEFATALWYYHRSAKQVLNGSTTHPKTPATRLNLSVVVDALEHAFHPGLIRKWVTMSGDPLNLFPKRDEGQKPEVKLVTRVVCRDLEHALDSAPPADVNKVLTGQPTAPTESGSVPTDAAA